MDFDQVAIFIGQNNSGKSNILDAIEFALGGSFVDQSLFYDKADIELDLFFDKDEQIKNQFPDGHATFLLKNGQKHLRFADKEITYNKPLSVLLSSRVKRLDDASFHDYHQIELDYHSLFNFPSNLESFRAYLKRHFPKISASKNAMDIRYENEGILEGKRKATIDRLGSGFRQIFTILLYIFHPTYSVVMINEPETHLHPAMIKKLLWAIQNSNAGQILFSTHSPLFITTATLPQVVRVDKDDNNQTRAFTIDHGHYNYKRLVQELNADNLEMFFTDKVILVEGVSDRLLFRGLIDKFYEGNKDIKVIQTDGKGNMQIYIDILTTFKIPFMVVLDRDVMRTQHLKDLMNDLDIHLAPLHDIELIRALKQYDIYVLDNGDLERNYPRKYQTDDTKSLNALKAASFITRQDYDSKTMKNLKEVIENI